MSVRIPAAALLAAVLALPAHAQWKPEKAVEVVVGVGPGGSMDRTARDVQRMFIEKKLLPVNSNVVNKPGGGHAVAMSYLAAHAGDGHFLQVVNVPLLTNQILGRGATNYADFTPIAMLFEEAMMFAVPQGSTVKDGKDLIARLRKDPASLSIGISTGIGTSNQLAAVLVARAAGANVTKLKAVAFNSAADSVTALVGGHIDVAVTTPFSIMPLVEAGKLRFIAIATPQRMGGALAQVPTWRELGVDSVVGAWRAVMAPPRLSKEQVDYWDGVFAKLVTQPEWRAELEENQVLDTYMPSAKTRQFFDAEYAKYRAVLTEIGMARQ